jgi:hypothetical protein
MRKMKKFADGGSDKYKAKYDRKIADIESDYAKAKTRKTGRGLEVAEAKYEQRMADAKDDLAKWTKSDRTATRAGEKAAERNLSLTRRFGSAKPKFEDKPLAAPKGPSEADVAKLASTARQGVSDAGSFKEAFAAARKDSSKPKTFTWRGKSYTTELASEKPKAATRSTPTRAATPAKAQTPAAKAQTPAAKAQTPAATAKAQTPAAKAQTPAATGRTAPGFKPSFGDIRAAQLRAGTEKDRKLESAPAGTPGAAAARLKKYLGITSSREASARTLETQAQRKRWQDVEAEGARNAADYAKAQKRAARIAAGNKPNATPTEKFYAKNPDAMKKGGSVKGYAKGGKIDGCAVRGKTRA